MSERFFRFHWADCPEFSAGNAWSALWGRERSADGSQTRCACEGSPQDIRECSCSRYRDEGPDPTCTTCGGEGFFGTCTTCDGTGWEDCVRGYSCVRDADELIRYFTAREHGQLPPEDDDGVVIVFTGQLAGVGFDGEPCAVPHEVLSTMTWSKFATSALAAG